MVSAEYGSDRHGGPCRGRTRVASARNCLERCLALCSLTPARGRQLVIILVGLTSLCDSAICRVSSVDGRQPRRATRGGLGPSKPECKWGLESAGWTGFGLCYGFVPVDPAKGRGRSAV